MCRCMYMGIPIRSKFYHYLGHIVTVIVCSLLLSHSCSQFTSSIKSQWTIKFVLLLRLLFHLKVLILLVTGIFFSRPYINLLRCSMLRTLANDGGMADWSWIATRDKKIPIHYLITWVSCTVWVSLPEQELLAKDLWCSQYMGKKRGATRVKLVRCIFKS